MAGLHAVVVDHDPSCLSLAAAILRRMGFTVEAFGIATEAINSGRGRPDVALIEVVSPGNISGLGVGALLASKYPGMKILYCSGYSPNMLFSEGHIPAEYRIGRGFLLKPFTGQALRDKLAKLLRDTPRLQRPPAE